MITIVDIDTMLTSEPLKIQIIISCKYEFGLHCVVVNDHHCRYQYHADTHPRKVHINISAFENTNYYKL